MKQFVYFSIVLSFLVGCSTTKQLSPLSQGTAIEATIIQLNDVYEIDALDGGKVGGMARVATIIKEEKKKNPNTLVVLAGDFLNPSLLGTLKYKGRRIRGQQMVEVMNAMGIDLVVFGNHEFDLKMPELQMRMDESAFDWLGTNVWQITDRGKEKFHKTADGKKKSALDHYIWNVQLENGPSVPVGIFGATIPSNPVDFVYYDDWTKTTREQILQLKNKHAKFIIGLTHLDELQDLALAKAVDGIDLILGGHDHNHMELEANGTKIYKADANAKTIYIHRLKIDPAGRHHEQSATLVKIDTSIADDPEIKRIVNKWNDILESIIKQIVDDPYEKIWHTNGPLDGREHSIRYHATNLGHIVTDAFLLASRKEADCAIVNSGSIRLDDQLWDDIYAIDIFRALPYGGHVAEVNMKGALLTKILDAGLDAKGNGAFLQRSSNIEYLPSTQEWFVDDVQIEAKKNYTVVLSDFLLLGYDIDFLTRDHPDINWIDEPDSTDKLDDRNDLRKVVINYLKSLER